jgi:hypothetical protein
MGHYIYLTEQEGILKKAPSIFISLIPFTNNSMKKGQRFWNRPTVLNFVHLFRRKLK